MRIILRLSFALLLTPRPCIKALSCALLSSFFCDYPDERQMECILFKLLQECREWYQEKLDISAQNKACNCNNNVSTYGEDNCKISLEKVKEIVKDK
eukprot:Pgem_evm1s12860